MHEFAGAEPGRPLDENRFRGSAAPVFVDRRGRRRRWVTYWGLLVALLGVLYVGLLTASLTADPVRPERGAPVDVPPAETVRRPAEVDAPE